MALFTFMELHEVPIESTPIEATAIEFTLTESTPAPLKLEEQRDCTRSSPPATSLAGSALGAGRSGRRRHLGESSGAPTKNSFCCFGGDPGSTMSDGLPASTPSSSSSSWSALLAAVPLLAAGAALSVAARTTPTPSSAPVSSTTLGLTQSHSPVCSQPAATSCAEARVPGETRPGRVEAGEPGVSSSMLLHGEVSPSDCGSGQARLRF
mmetsp:Transcript_21532/g.50647  ORF Transcript_21532/g.50647 Transcript_21532/m.50647 type:complete len:209 (+) Transcript_21532:3142-3768(+)